MPELTQDLIDKINETRDTVIEVKTVLLGKNSDKGLVGLVDDNTNKSQKNETRSKVNRALISIAFSILGIGSGAGVTKLLNLW